jgi:hypothetical protein
VFAIEGGLDDDDDHLEMVSLLHLDPRTPPPHNILLLLHLRPGVIEV